MNLNEKIHHIVKRAINEELGINSLVTKATDDIVSMVSNGYCELRDIPIGRNRHIPYKATNIDYDFVNGKVVHLNIGLYEFDTVDNMLRCKKEYPSEYRKMMNASTRQIDELSKITITANIIMVGNKVEAFSYNALQHELEHAFQRIMSNRTELTNNQSKYTTNIGIMGNKGGDIYIKNAARINYYSYRHEQDAFGNGLYGEIKHSNPTPENIDILIKNSKFYSVLKKLREVVGDFENLQGEERDIIDSMIRDKFGYGIDTVIKRGNKDIDEFVYRMGRVKMLILNKLKKKTLNETISSKQEDMDISILWSRIKDELKKCINDNEIKYDDNYQVLFYKDNFLVNTKSIGVINIEFLFYILDTEVELKYFRRYANMLPQNCEADYDERKIIVRGVYFKDSQSIDEVDTYKSLSHEYHHLYQYNCGFIKTQHQSNLYEICVNGSRDGNQVINNVSKLIYHTFKHEISASTVEVFQNIRRNKEIIKNGEININSIKEISNFYQEFLKLIDIFEQIIDDYDNIDQIIENYFGITVNMIYRRINKAEVVYDNYFKKIIVKLQRENCNLLEEKNNTNFMIECFIKKYTQSYIL